MRAVWVIFDRGRDMLRFYGDPDVQRFAQRNDWALLLAFHCRAKTTEDMNVDPDKGLGRALITALNQLADATKHPELQQAKLVALSFSGPGCLVARLPEYAPDRFVAVIPADAGQGDPLGLDTVRLSPRGIAVPQLVLSGGSDGVSGTARPYAYFRKYFDQGAPWTFVVQNRTPHCCIINTKSLVLEWLSAVALKDVTRREGAYGFIKTTPSGIDDCPSPRPPLTPPSCHGGSDTWGAPTWSASAVVTSRRGDVPNGMVPAGWLPTRRFAGEWRAFVSQPEHPITSMP